MELLGFEKIGEFEAMSIPQNKISMLDKSIFRQELADLYLLSSRSNVAKAPGQDVPHISAKKTWGWIPNQAVLEIRMPDPGPTERGH